MGVTIRDVALAAGVSATTVSRVFNRGHLVNPETRAHILRIAEELRYTPNATARNLSIRRTRVIGLILARPYTDFFIEVIRGMDEAALRLGYSLLISGVRDGAEDARAALRNMKGQVDGFLVVAPNLENDALRDVLPADHPALFLHAPAPTPTAGSVRIANREGAVAAVRHLVALGHRRIAIIKGPEHNQETPERLEGYRQALEEAGLAWCPELELPGNFTRESGVEAAHRLLGLAPRPTAVFACSDLMAIGALTVFHAAGLRVPDDVAVIGFDDIPMASFVTPSLSTVHVPIYEMGRNAVEHLVAALDADDPAGCASEVLQTTVIPRASTLGDAFDTKSQILNPKS